MPYTARAARGMARTIPTASPSIGNRIPAQCEPTDRAGVAQRDEF